MPKFMIHLFALLALVWSGPALADVQIHFHSVNGSVLFGRYPHTFVVLDGELEATGEVINENYGFSARKVTPAILSGPVEHMVLAEKPKFIQKTNRHFTITITDDEYRAIIREVNAWQNAPGKYYNLESRNCIHFVGKMAEILGLTVEVPEDMLRRPKRWLNHIVELNPKLGATKIK